KSAAPESHHAIEVEIFVDASAIGPQYVEKPYVLVPAKKAEKGYVLLREALARTGKIGIARVVIRTRENLCAVMPQDNALLLLRMRYPQELVDVAEYDLPEGAGADYRITAKEQQFSEQLIETMSGEWDPEQYQDQFRERLQQVIKQRMSEKGLVQRHEEEPAVAENATTNVVDFMSLLQQSIQNKARTPAQKRPAAADESVARPAKKPAAKKPATKKTAAKGAAKSAKKAAAKKAPKKTGTRAA